MTTPAVLCIRSLPSCVEFPEEKEWRKDVVPLVNTNKTASSSDNLHAALLSAPSYSTFVIGRRPNCSIRLQDTSISGWHCKLILVRSPIVKTDFSAENSAESCTEPLSRRANGVSIYLVDTSTNGTFVDGKRVAKDVPTLITESQIVALGRGKPPGTPGPYTAIQLPLSQQTVFAFRAMALTSERNSAVVDLVEFSGSEGLQPNENGTGRAMMNCASPDGNNEFQGPAASGSGALRHARNAATAQSGAGVQFFPLSSTSIGNDAALDSFRPNENSIQPNNLTGRGSWPSKQDEFQAIGRVVTPPRVKSKTNIGPTQSTMSSSGLLDKLDTNSNSASRGASKLTDMIKRLQEENSKKDEEIAELAEEVERAEAARVLTQSRYEAMTAQIVQYREQLAEAEAQVAKLTQLVHTEQEKSALQKTDLETRNRECDSWKREAEELQTRLSVLNSRLDSAVGQHRELQQENSRLTAKLLRSEEEIDELKIRATQTATQVEAARSEVATVKKLLESHTIEAAARERQGTALLATAQKATEAAEARVALAENEIATLMEAKKASDLRLITLTDTTKNLENEVSTLRNELSMRQALSGRLRDLLSECHRYSSQLTAVNLAVEPNTILSMGRSEADASDEKSTSRIGECRADLALGEGRPRYFQQTAFITRTPASSLMSHSYYETFMQHTEKGRSDDENRGGDTDTEDNGYSEPGDNIDTLSAETCREECTPRPVPEKRMLRASHKRHRTSGTRFPQSVLEGTDPKSKKPRNNFPGTTGETQPDQSPPQESLNSTETSMDTSSICMTVAGSLPESLLSAAKLDCSLEMASLEVGPLEPEDLTNGISLPPTEVGVKPEIDPERAEVRCHTGAQSSPLALTYRNIQALDNEPSKSKDDKPSTNNNLDDDPSNCSSCPTAGTNVTDSAAPSDNSDHAKDHHMIQSDVAQGEVVEEKKVSSFPMLHGCTDDRKAKFMRGSVESNIESLQESDAYSDALETSSSVSTAPDVKRAEANGAASDNKILASWNSRKPRNDISAPAVQQDDAHEFLRKDSALNLNRNDTQLIASQESQNRTAPIRPTQISRDGEKSKGYAQRNKGSTWCHRGRKPRSGSQNLGGVAKARSGTTTRKHSAMSEGNNTTQSSASQSVVPVSDEVDVRAKPSEKASAVASTSSLMLAPGSPGTTVAAEIRNAEAEPSNKKKVLPDNTFSNVLGRRDKVCTDVGGNTEGNISETLTGTMHKDEQKISSSEAFLAPSLAWMDDELVETASI